MKAPNCGISDSDWTAYLDPSSPHRERQKLGVHLRVCAECRSELETLRRIDQRLRIECGLIQQSINVPAKSQAAAQERILAILQESDLEGSHERLWRVRWVLALLCGSNTAARIIQATESQTRDEQEWPLVLRRLAFLTTEICGSYAGDLIRAVGQ
jgi:hypothetical protein